MSSFMFIRKNSFRVSRAFVPESVNCPGPAWVRLQATTPARRSYPRLEISGTMSFLTHTIMGVSFLTYIDTCVSLKSMIKS